MDYGSYTVIVPKILLWVFLVFFLAMACVSIWGIVALTLFVAAMKIYDAD